MQLRMGIARRAVTGVANIRFAGWIEPQKSFIWLADFPQILRHSYITQRGRERPVTRLGLSQALESM